MPLRSSFEDDDRLVGARHHWLGDGDQLPLLAENAQPRGLPIAGIKLRRRVLRHDGLSRLNLRERQIELGAVPHAFFDHRQYGGAR